MFATVVTSAVPEHLRGYLGRFMLEPKPGVFVGNVSPRVASGIWHRSVEAAEDGSVVMVTSDPSQEAGYSVQTTGLTDRRICNENGLELVALQTNPQAS
jgi:CRISPR-associated protein Cas2